MPPNSEQNSHLSPRRALLLERLMKQRASTPKEQSIQRRTFTGPCPLSYAQELMWLLDQLNPDGSTAYNSIWTGRVRGPLNIAALHQALNALIERHQILRTVYAVREGAPVQVVTENRLSELSLIDLSHLPEPEREQEAERLLSEEVRRPFDLTRDLMMRVVLLGMGEQDYLLLLDMHHIAIDGWSKEVIYRELNALYEAFSSGKLLSLPELPIQYADFAVWQRNWLKDELLDKQLAYWKQHLLGAPPLLELPTDHPRPAVQAFRGSHERTVFRLGLLEELKSLSRREGATLFMTLMAAFQTLLYRYSEREDMLVATVVANRQRPELENLIGYFSNSLVLRTDLSGDPGFRELLSRVRDVALEAYEHQDMPFEKLVVELKPERDLSYTPLYQVMLNLQNHEREEIKLRGLDVRDLKTERGSSKFDLTLNLVEKSDGLRVAFEYNTDLFERPTIRRMLGHFETLLEAIVANPDQPISRLPLLTAAERHQLLVAWNDTQRDYQGDLCLHQLFEAQVERTPEAVAVVYEGQRLTYAELNRRANQLAHFLRKSGVGIEARVTICLERSLEMVVGVLGILKAGGAYVPLAAEYAQERLPSILEDSQSCVLLTEKRLRLPSSLPHELKVIDLDRDWQDISRESTENPAQVATPDALAYVIYTSGSTGTPKGVMVAHRSLVNAYQAWEEAYQLRSLVRSHLQMANFSFDVFTGDLVRALCSGGKLVLCPLEFLLDPAKLYQLMLREKIDCAEFVPSVLRNLLEHLNQSGESIDFLRLVVAGSDIWYVEEFRAVERLSGAGTRVINSYGVAEATIDSSYYETGQVELSSGGVVPIGRPFPNTQLYVLDRQLQPVPIGVPGELYIGGQGLARGYLNAPKLTLEKFIPDPFSPKRDRSIYKTGDRARFLADGNIEFLGRIDHQVKIRGFRVELGEIEVVLSDHPDVQEAVVVAHTLARGEKQLVAYVVPKQERVATQHELRRFLKEKLPAYMVPSTFVVIKALPLTANGKIDRKALPRPEPATRQGGDGLLAPRSPQEKMLAQIWAEVLKVDQVGIEDNFFELGGHSLSAIRVVSRIRENFQLDLSVRSLFENPTIAEMGEFIEATQNHGAVGLEPPIVRVSRDSVRAKRSSFVV